MGGIDLVQKFKDGGIIMWPILGCSVLAIMFTVERFIVLLIQKAKLKPTQFLEAFERSMKKNRGDKVRVVDEMTRLCKKRGGVCAEVMLEGLQKFQHAQSMRMGIMEMKQWLTGAIEERARIELPQLESHLGIIAITANIAPLLGLLGTVSGMIQSFEVMASAAGGAKPDELAGGIAVALTTTVGGLVVAIPSLVFYNAIKGAIENYVVMIEEAAIRLVDTLIIEG
jgi:biopolymer transport protein ExbB